MVLRAAMARTPDVWAVEPGHSHRLENRVRLWAITRLHLREPTARLARYRSAHRLFLPQQRGVVWNSSTKSPSGEASQSNDPESSSVRPNGATAGRGHRVRPLRARRAR